MSEIAKCPVCGKEPGTSGRIVDGVDVVENVDCCNAWFGDPEEWTQYATLRAENERLKGEVERLREALSSIEHGRAQIPHSSTIFMDGTQPLVWKMLNKYDMQDVARRALLTIHPNHG